MLPQNPQNYIWVGANLKDIKITHSDLSVANLRGTNLRGTNLSYSDLRNANLKHANLSYAILSYAVTNNIEVVKEYSLVIFRK
jgi:uncharacterized protein YjbI with pentapeptide repeats